MDVRERALDNKCPACHASINFNPTLGKWKCEYCDSEFTLEEMQKYNNASSQENNKSDETQKIVVDENGVSHVSYHCKDCGAQIIADEQTAATFCIYCGNTAILKSKLSNEFAPDKIIPFKTEKQSAVEAFKKLKKGRPFIPKDFLSEKNIEKIKGVYIPFWIYDVHTEGSLNCDGKKITTWRVGDTHYTKTSIYKIYRTGKMDFLKVPVDGSTRFDDDMMNSIEPFNYDELEKYNHAYLSGFLAEKYDVDGDTAKEMAFKRSLESAKDTMYNDSIGYNSKTIYENTIISQETKREYMMLPVWMVNVKYNDKMYLFAMNGQTGKFIGNIPLDKKKVIKMTIIIFIISLLVCTLGSYIIFLMGGK